MKINVVLTGTTALLMHNERLSDPADQFTRAIKEITDKGTNQTDLDKEHISALEWMGAVYHDNERRPIMPSKCIVRCFREAAAITKNGKKIAGSFTPAALHFLMIHPGPKTVDELCKMPMHIDRRQVKIGRGRISRTRPIFPQWAVQAQFSLLEDVMNLSTLQKIGDLAGMAIGLCDARILGHGRFECSITKA